MFSAINIIDLVSQFTKQLKRKNNELSELKPFHRSSTPDHLPTSYLSSNFVLTVFLAASPTTIFLFVDLSSNALLTSGPFITVSSTVILCTFCRATYSISDLLYVNHKKTSSSL